MKLDIDSIVYLEKLLSQDTFNDKLFKKFINTKGIRGFLVHEPQGNRRIRVKILRKEIQKIMEFKKYKDGYGFHNIRDNLPQLREDVQYIKEKKQDILDEAIKETYKIVPHDMSFNGNIYLYIGGDDGGFTVNREKIYINYGKYMGNIEEFIKIISHELYHSRNIDLKDRFFFFLDTLSNTNMVAHEIIAKIMEEGIACLVQQGPVLLTDDPTGTLTKRSLLFLKEEFELLNQIILKDIRRIKNQNRIENLNIYAIGYYIVTTVYNKKGVLILDDWTRNLKYRRIIQTYIEICNEYGIVSGFTHQAKNVLTK